MKSFFFKVWLSSKPALMVLGSVVFCAALLSPQPIQAKQLQAGVETWQLQSASSQGVAPKPGFVGIELSIEPRRYPYLLQVFPHSPAAQAGLQAGDQILAINEQSTLGLDRSAVDLAISEVPGTLVKFRVQRNVDNRSQPILNIQVTVGRAP